MSFAELREGTLYTTKERTKITNPDFLSKLWNASKTVKPFIRRISILREMENLQMSIQ